MLLSPVVMSAEKNFATNILYLAKVAKKSFVTEEVAEALTVMNAMDSCATNARGMMIALSASNGGGRGEKGRIHYLF